MDTPTTCSSTGCTATRLKARGMCGTHYDRWYVEQRTGHHVQGRETHAAAGTCVADDCSEQGYGVPPGGPGVLCKKHAARWRRNGRLELLTKAEASERMRRPSVDKGVCMVTDCTTKARSRGGMCEMHYHRQRNGVDLFTVRTPAPELTMEYIRGNTESGSAESYTQDCHLWTGRLTKDGYGYEYDPELYRQRRDGLRDKTNTTVLIHRHVFALANPSVSLDGVTLDHRCHDPARCSEGDRCPHRRCCNPDHLVIEDRGVNAKRKSSLQRVVVDPRLSPEEAAKRAYNQLFFSCGHLRIDENFHGKKHRCKACYDNRHKEKES